MKFVIVIYILNYVYWYFRNFFWREGWWFVGEELVVEVIDIFLFSVVSGLLMGGVFLFEW